MAENNTEASEPVKREEYTPKQVATRIGTDAKTLRKFFRSPDSTVEPVGQGGRYVFKPEDLPKIKSEFDSWNSKRGTRTRGGATKVTAADKAKSVSEEIEELDDELDDELEELDDEEPEEQELEDIAEEDEDIEDFDLDLDELDD